MAHRLKPLYSKDREAIFRAIYHFLRNFRRLLFLNAENTLLKLLCEAF